MTCHLQWGSPSASDPRAKNRAQRATKGTVPTSQSLSLWCNCRRLGSTLASWRWQDINVGNALWRRTLLQEWQSAVQAKYPNPHLNKYSMLVLLDLALQSHSVSWEAIDWHDCDQCFQFPTVGYTQCSVDGINESSMYYTGAPFKTWSGRWKIKCRQWSFAGPCTQQSLGHGGKCRRGYPPPAGGGSGGHPQKIWYFRSSLVQSGAFWASHFPFMRIWIHFTTCIIGMGLLACLLSSYTLVHAISFLSHDRRTNAFTEISVEKPKLLIPGTWYFNFPATVQAETFTEQDSKWKHKPQNP